jgi:TonB family protein
MLWPNPEPYGPESAETRVSAYIANSPNFDLYQFLPKMVDFKGLNRFPKVAYVVDEDGRVSNVKILKSTGSPKVDSGLVKSIMAWKYRAQPGCRWGSFWKSDTPRKNDLHS